jgi:PilZ domain
MVTRYLPSLCIVVCMQTTTSPLPRFHTRTAVSVDVVIVGVLDRFNARIADLSEGGALIVGASLPARSRCEIHYGGQIVYATVMWSDPDRMGLRFPFELHDGPLHQRLVIARSHHQARPLAGLARASTGFGRRGL